MVGQSLYATEDSNKHPALPLYCTKSEPNLNFEQSRFQRPRIPSGLGIYRCVYIDNIYKHIYI